MFGVGFVAGPTAHKEDSIALTMGTATNSQVPTIFSGLVASTIGKVKPRLFRSALVWALPTTLTQMPKTSQILTLSGESNTCSEAFIRIWVLNAAMSSTGSNSFHSFSIWMYNKHSLYFDVGGLSCASIYY